MKGSLTEALLSKPVPAKGEIKKYVVELRGSCFGMFGCDNSAQDRIEVITRQFEEFGLFGIEVVSVVPVPEEFH